jgi:hypothetical protein
VIPISLFSYYTHLPTSTLPWGEEVLIMSEELTMEELRELAEIVARADAAASELRTGIVE